jgi:predicted DNA-binding protein (UPF0251 family)
VKRITSKYPDVALAKALRNALKVADTARARIVWQRAFALLKDRGASSGYTQSETPDELLYTSNLHDAWWILSSALSMGTMAADYRERLAACARFFDAGRPRRPPLTPKDRPLTPRQAEVMQIVAECKGNLAEAATRLDIDRKSLKESYDAGMGKLAKAGVPIPANRPKPKKNLSLDHQKKPLTIAAQDEGPAFHVSPRRPPLRDRR